MQIVYVHGLDGSANSVKGRLLERYCQHHYPNAQIVRPDLNLPPEEVLEALMSQVNLTPSLLIGSSLGGYFSSLVSNLTGTPALLLNPSTQPHISLQRFLEGQSLTDQKSIIYQSKGGWDITLAHLQWFNEHRLTQINYPTRLFALIKSGDELLNPQIAVDFYRSFGVEVVLQAGGNHRMTDFADQLPLLIEKAKHRLG